MRVAIADDSGLFREGLALLLETAGVEVAAQARSGEELFAVLPKLGEAALDAVVLDIRMPPTFTDEGIRAAHQVRRERPGVGVLVLSTYAETAYAVQLLEQGARGLGYLLKDRVDDAGSLREALERVVGGETVVDPQIVERLLRRRSGAPAVEKLSEREREVLTLMAEGRSNAGIARRLHLGLKTVEGHVANIFMRLELNSDSDDNRRVLAVLSWLRTLDQE